MTTLIPQRTAEQRHLREIIAGLTEGVILVSPDRSIVWANDAALAMHGVERIEDLGSTVDDYQRRFELRYRNNHKVTGEDHPMNRTLSGETLADVVVEVIPKGMVEPQWIHRIRSLILSDASDQPEFLVLVLHDATERFEAEERFETTFRANPAPAIITRISDLRYVKVNTGFLEMTGYTREDVIGRSVYEIDILDRAEKKEQAIERLNEWRTIPQMEAVLKGPDGAAKPVVVAGQPIEIGDERCMLFTFMDLEPRKKAEDALRQSEERFSKAFRLAPVPTMISALDSFQILDVNDAFVAATGYTAEQVVARTAPEIGLWASADLRAKFEHELRQTGTVRSFESQLCTREGATLDCIVSADTVTIQGRACILSAMQDITARKRSETELIEAIEAVMQDTSWFSRTVIDKLANLRNPNRSHTSSHIADLTARERDVLALICKGLADKEIAGRLELSNSTVRNCVSSIYRKIDVKRRSAAVIWAHEHGFTADGALPEQPDRRS